MLVTTGCWMWGAGDTEGGVQVLRQGVPVAGRLGGGESQRIPSCK